MTLSISELHIPLNGHLMLDLSCRYILRAQFCQPTVFRKCVVSKGVYWILVPNRPYKLPTSSPVSKISTTVERYLPRKAIGSIYWWLNGSSPREGTVQYHGIYALKCLHMTTFLLHIYCVCACIHIM